MDDDIEVTIKLPLELVLRIQLLATESRQDHNTLIANALKFFYSPNSENWESFGGKSFGVNREISEEGAKRKAYKK